MTKLKVSTTALEYALGIGSMQARISGVSFNIADSCFYFDIEGSEVPEIPVVVVRSVRTNTITFEPA